MVRPDGEKTDGSEHFIADFLSFPRFFSQRKEGQRLAIKNALVVSKPHGKNLSVIFVKVQPV